MNYRFTKKKRTRKPKSPRQRLIKICDDLWAETIKVRDGKCRKTGRVDNLQAAHIISRGHFSTRWMLENGLTLTGGVHFRYTFVDNDKWADFCISQIGKEAYDSLKFLAEIRMHHKPNDLQLISIGLQAQLTKLKKERGLI